MSNFRLNTLFRFKDSLKEIIRSEIIYRYTCSSCNVTYYGKSFRHVSRTLQHMRICNLTRKSLNKVKQPAISHPKLQRNCAPTFGDFSILANDSNKFKLLLRDSLLIKRDIYFIQDDGIVSITTFD